LFRGGFSGFSTFDGLGYPEDHIKWIVSESQGMDAWALTDHGNGNGLAHAHSAAKKLQKKGVKYRQLYGVEFYFVPSLTQWKIDYEAHKQAIKDAKTAAEAEKKAKVRTDVDADEVEEEEAGGHVVEDENETKADDYKEKPDWQRRYHLVAVAQTAEGLANINRLVKASFKDGFYRYPRIDFDLLRKYGKGIVWSTACLGGIYSGTILRGEAYGKNSEQIISELMNLTDRFTDAVGTENFFLEIQFNKLPKQHTVNRYLIDLSRKSGVKLLATCDSHYPDPSKWQARELYKKLGWMGAKLDEQALPKFEDLKCELYPKNASQMWDEYKKSYEQYEFYRGSEEEVRDAIERTHDIAWQHCEDTWVDVKAKLPKLDMPGKTTFQQLTELVKEALIREGLSDKPEYVARVKEELSDIKYLGHASYFVTMYKIFKKAETRTLFGPGRGSGAGSLVNYLLGITQIDPLPYGLLWSRFLGRHRVSWPDIDSDAGDRDALIDSARELFGDDAVIPVSNFNTLKLKSLVKDIAKIYGVPFEEVNEMTGPLQDEVMPLARDDDQEKSVFVLKHEDCMKYSPKYKAFMEKYPDVAAHVETLFMQNRSVGRHAGGVIVADPDDLAATMPIIGVRGELQTPWTEGMNFRNLEDNGFLKFDFLGLTLLKDVENCIRRILVNQGNPDPTFLNVKAFFDKHLNCRYVKQDDPEVWKHVYHEGRFVGVFQFTAQGARKFCMQSQPNCIEDLSAITAIYRPGPLKANVHNMYVDAGKDLTKIKYDHPLIEKVLGPTRGFITFQEQFMSLAVELAGFNPGESDQMRKTLVKKSLDTLDKKGGEKAMLREKFVKGAKEIHGISEDITNALFDKIEFFSLYGFNKSHSVAYAIDSYYAAWLHTHYEKDWLATILQSANSNPKELTKVIGEIKSLGYKFSKIDINYSGKEWQFSEKADAFVPPITSAKGIGSTAVDEIMENRPYKNLKEMLYDAEGNWRHSKVNKTALSALCKIEALESLEDFQGGSVRHHRQLLLALTEDKNYETLRKGIYGLTAAQLKKLAKEGIDPLPVIDVLLEEQASTVDWTRDEKISMAYDLTSTADVDLLFPPDIMKKLLEKGVQSLHDVQPGSDGIGWFLVTEVNLKKTKNGKAFYRCKAIDNDSRQGWIRIWGNPTESIDPYTLWVGQASNDPSWGFSTSIFKLRKVA
jgi:DNA polymerase-3 subunit alpha